MKKIINNNLKFKTAIDFRFLFLLSLLAISLSVSSYAEEEKDDIEEIVVTGKVLYVDQVTALKTPVPVINVPQSVSIITNDDILKKGFREIGDIVRYTPGVNTSQGEGHRDAVVFRGVRSTADFYLDGIRDDVQYYRSLYNLEQVEILRGANALLFGRGGTGGVINRVTKKAIVGSNFTSYNLGLDTFGSSDLAVDYNMEMNDRSALRVNVHIDSLENHRDYYNGDRLGINPTLHVELSSETTLDLSYEYADHERFIDRGIPTGSDGKPVESLKDIVFGDKDANITTLKAHIFRATLNHKFSETSKAILSVLSSDFDKMYQNIYAQAYDESTNVVTMDGYYDPTERENFIVSGNLVNEFQFGKAKHTLLLGVEIIDTDNKNIRYDSFWSTNTLGASNDDRESFNVTRPMDFTTNSIGAATILDFSSYLKSDTTSDIEVSSFLIQDQIDVSEKLKLMIGGRVDNFDITVDNLKKAEGDSQRSVFSDDSHFSPRAGIVYKPQENVSWYASYSESFLPRSGEQFKALSATVDANDNCVVTSCDNLTDADVFENKEIGFKRDISNALSFTAAYFWQKQVRASYDNTTGENMEVRGTKVDGIEFELKGKINDRVDLTLGYSNLDGETSSGVTPREIPEKTLSAWASFAISERSGWGFGVMHQGKSLVSDGSSKILPSYTRIDLAGYYDLGNDLVLQLNAENLTDELYFPHSHSSHQVSVGESRNVRISLNKLF